MAYHAVDSAPLIRGFDRIPPEDMQLSTEEQFRGEFLFADQEFDAALVSPAAYGKDAEELSLVPGCDICSIAGTGSIRLVFREELHHFSSVSVPQHHAWERMLLQVVLAEKYGMRPDLVERRAVPGELENGVDAILLTGDEALVRFQGRKASIDLVDEWIDLTELPFVHAVWVLWNSRSSPFLIEGIQKITAEARATIHEVSAAEAERLGLSAESLRDRYGKMEYILDEEGYDGLNAAFRMAFFYGLRSDIPNLNLWNVEEGG